jgi:hypothetical protein
MGPHSIEQGAGHIKVKQNQILDGVDGNDLRNPFCRAARFARNRSRLLPRAIAPLPGGL